MTICQDIMTFVEKIAPCELAEEWDNVGLLVGNRESRIEKIMLCLDITTTSVDEAVKENVDMIVTHHPVIFKGLKSLIDGEGKGSLLYTLIRNDINVYAAHTNLDFSESGVNTHLAAALGIKSLERLGEGPGKAGIPDKSISLDDFIKQVKIDLDVPFVRVVGKTDGDVKKVAVFCGSFDDNLEVVRQSNVDVLVTGDLKYHTALEALEAGLCIIDAGHFNTEKVVLPALANALEDNFPGIEVFCFLKEEDPFKTY